MKHTLLTAAICALLCATSCQNNKGYEFPKAPEQVFLTEKNMPPIEYFTLEKVDVPEGSEMSDAFFIYNDTLLIALNNKNPKPYILSFYNYKTNKFLAGALKKGTGPGEMLSILPILSGNELLIWDAMLSAVTQINLDSICFDQPEISPSIIYLQGGTSYYNIRIVSDSLVGYNINHFYGFGCEKEPEFFKISCKDGEIPFPPENMEYHPENIGQRTGYYNKHTHQYLTCWFEFPYIHIYDENFNLQKQYIGPEVFLPEILDEPTLLSKEFKLCYQIGVQTENYIFLIYYRAFESQTGEFAQYQPQELFCFDKNLNMIRRFKSKNEMSMYWWLSYCENTGELYINAKDEKDENALYKCIFEK